MGSISLWHWLILIIVPFGIPLLLKFAFGIGAKPIPMKNPITGQLKTGYYGYSWTYLYFGWWVPLLRGELGVAALHFFFSIFTLGIWQVIVSFMFNSQYTNRRISDGYRLAGNPEQRVAAAEAIGLDLDVHSAALS